jgi:predicted nucleotidyltransferase
MVKKRGNISQVPRHVLMEYAVRLYHELLAKKIRTDALLLYGSQAKLNTHQDSDIDFAVISRDFGQNQMKENILVNSLAMKIDTRISAVTFGFKDFFSRDNAIPLRHEIMKYGICLL